MVFRKPNFGPPPEGYIAGLGRGAVGFITRGDMGAARIGESTFGGQQLNAPPPGLIKKPTGQQESLRPDTSEANYDEWSGYGGSLFAGLKEDQEDREADADYAQVDNYLQGRRQKKREEKIMELNRVYAQENVNIKAKFVDAKKRLADVTREDWEALPDAQDLVKQNKKRKLHEKQRYTPVPDSVLQSNSQLGQIDNQIDPRSALPGSTGSVIDGTQSTIAEIGEARQKILQIEMNRAQSQIGTITSQVGLNKEGYMTDLNSMKLNTETEINDLKKARILLKAVIKANPTSSSGWVAAARVEELDGKLQEARSLLDQACIQFPSSEDVWFEAARLQDPVNQNQFIAKAVQNIPSSKKLWILAAQKEDDIKIKSKVFRRALEHLPTEVDLWKELVQLEEPEEAKQLLTKAVACIPNSVSLWLALAKLETYKDARSVLNKALNLNPQSIEIYISAAQLEEAQQNIEIIPKVIKKMIKNLQASRELFLQEAVKCEKANSLLTCEQIVDSSIIVGDLQTTDKKQRKQAWLSNVEACLDQGAIFTARFILKSALKLHDMKALWMKAYQIEKDFGNIHAQIKLLERACLSKHEFLRLLLAKLMWKQMGQPEQALQILLQQEQTIDVCLAVQKIQRHLKMFDAALQSLSQTAENQDYRVLMQKIQVYREIGQDQNALEHCNSAIEILKKEPFWKIYLIKAQILETMTSDIDQVRLAYEQAIQNCGKSNSQVWTEAALFEVRVDAVTRARTILQKARIKLPTSAEIWLNSIRIELQVQNDKIAAHLMSRALQQCPDSGQLWALAIQIEPQATRVRKCTDAVTKNKSDPHIFLAIGKIFWAEHKLLKARKFLQRAVELDKDLADAWLYLIAFEKIHNQSVIQQLKSDFVEADPKHGELWQSHSKKILNWSKSPLELLDEIKVEPPKLH